MFKCAPLGLGEGTKGYRESEMQEQERTPESESPDRVGRFLRAGGAQSLHLVIYVVLFSQGT